MRAIDIQSPNKRPFHVELLITGETSAQDIRLGEKMFARGAHVIRSHLLIIDTDMFEFLITFRTNVTDTVLKLGLRTGISATVVMDHVGDINIRAAALGTGFTKIERELPTFAYAEMDLVEELPVEIPKIGKVLEILQFLARPSLKQIAGQRIGITDRRRQIRLRFERLNTAVRQALQE